jgi:hypothetical protein
MFRMAPLLDMSTEVYIHVFKRVQSAYLTRTYESRSMIGGGKLSYHILGESCHINARLKHCNEKQHRDAEERGIFGANVFALPRGHLTRLRNTMHLLETTLSDTASRLLLGPRVVDRVMHRGSVQLKQSKGDTRMGSGVFQYVSCTLQ